MIRVILFLAAVLALATGLSWLADRPGNLTINWEGYVIETSVFRAVVLSAIAIGAALVLWSLIRHVWNSPAAVGNIMNRRRQKKGLEALSAGMIAVGAGDRANATRYAILARKTLPNEPMTHLLRAQAAQLAGDKTTSRRIFEGMLASPDTEPLGLRGLFLEAQRETEAEAAQQFAERALKLNPKLIWASDALFDIQCRAGDWAGALETLSSARKNGLIEKPLADRRRAVLLAAQAIKAEDAEPDRALALAIEAHNLAPDLVPAAAQAGRMLASRGNTPRAAKILERTWSKSPHPDIATVYAFARVGDSPRDRLVRVKRLAEQNPYSVESAIAVANAAIDARAFDEARDALKPMLEDHLTQRIATLMARLESEQFGDKGGVREWLARAVNAPRDPVWTADGIVSDEWAPVSPVTGALDAFQWKVPVENITPRDNDLIARKVEELVALGGPSRISAVADDVVTVEAEPVTERPAAKTAPEPAPETTGRTRTIVVEAAPQQHAPSPAAGRSASMAAGKEASSTTVEADNRPATPRPEVLRPSPRPRADESQDLAGARQIGPTGEGAPAAAPWRQAAAGSGKLAVAPEPKPGGAVTAKSAPSAPPARQESSRAGEGKSAPSPVNVRTAVDSPARPSVATDTQKPATTPRKSDTTVASAPAPAATGEAAAKTAAAPDAAKAVPVGKDSGREGKEPRIFVVPHAPDDPGPDGSDTDPPPPKGTRPPYRALP